MRKNLQYYLLGILVLGLANVFVWQFVFGLASPGGGLKVIFFDIGQGDSIFIETPAKHQILIDGGPSNEAVEKLGKQMPFWDKTIDVVILTHPDYDHLRGLLDVLDNYQVKNILWTGELSEGKTFEAWQEKIEQEGAKIILATAGTKIIAEQVEMDVLYPMELPEQDSKNNNNSSIVAKMVYGQTKFLFTGDAEKPAEKEMLLQGQDLFSDVLKVAHHGSKSATSLEFLANVKPEIAVISVGARNTYGHPHQEVLSNLLEFGIKVKRTDQQGDISLFSNGQNIIY
ncbi:MAG: ComEC/Rec2 family competence protein [Candidatus Pacebacteria bacterium]|nr:ComEC/Rec2 family competence protein [Candidatus Paceibacterota bacterium]